ncbi:MAG: hypothetical protein SO016_08740 [Lachnospiraceae bacterium]|nr:hypothetical protein [Robinsoniella sp.]MDY3766758.1 hypothetical protein [Lachnospiraceae bacterium]
MKKEMIYRAVFEALNREENDKVVTLALREEAIFIQFSDGTKYQIKIEETEEQC